MNIADHIDRGARQYGQRTALMFDGASMTYGELGARSDGAAEVFRAAGTKPGDRVAIFLPNVPEFAVAYLGTLKAGAIAVSVNSSWKRDEVAFVLGDCGARVAVTCADLRDQISAERVYTIGENFEGPCSVAAATSGARSMRPEDPAAIVYTSGTTGRPKGATLSHQNVVRNMEAKKRYLGIQETDRGLLFLPLYHCFGQNAVFNAFLQAGATLVLQRRFELHAVLVAIAHDGVTMLFGVPTTFQLLLGQAPREAMGTVRYCFSAAAPLPAEIEERWERKFGMPIHQGYGLTETSPFASYNHAHSHRAGSIGTPIDGVEMKIVDPETGAELAPGQTGEIAVRGHNVMLGYWNRPEDTARAIRDGWFHTGDVGRVDAEGYFYIQDRLDDLINTGGVNIYPAEIENVLHGHPAVAEAAVYGVREALLHERVFADVVLRPGACVSEGELRAFCGKRLARVKVPAVFHFVEEIPVSPAGKILKRVLRDRAAAACRAPQGAARVSRREAEGWIGEWLRQNLGLGSLPDLDCGAAFADLGLDSIMSVRLATEISEWLGRDIGVTATWSFPTIGALASHAATGGEARREAAAGIDDLSNEAVEAALMAELELLSR